MEMFVWEEMKTGCLVGEKGVFALHNFIREYRVKLKTFSMITWLKGFKQVLMFLDV